MPSQPASARRHALTRRQHHLETAEDYVEAIAELIAETGQARVTDLARRLGVAHPTAIQTVKRLQERGLVDSPPYKAIALTPSGRHLAETSRRRHELVVAFLLRLGVPAETAQSDAEGLEHHVSPATLRAMERFLREGANKGVKPII